MVPNTSLLLKPGHRQMGLPNVFLAGGQSDVPHYFHFCRPRQLRPNRAVGAPHSGDANAIDGQSRQPDIWLELPIITIQAMMALAGFAYSALVCSSFSRAQKRVIEMGFSDDINTYVMISGGVDALCLP